MSHHIGQQALIDKYKGAAMLLSARYDTTMRCVELLYYVPSTGQIMSVLDETYKPYVYTRLDTSELSDMPIDDIISVSSHKIHDLLSDGNETVTKITMNNPYIASTLKMRYPDMHETDVKCDAGCIYDTGRRIGAYYDGSEPVKIPVDPEVELEMKSLLWDSKDADALPEPEKYVENMRDTAIALNQPIPNMRRLAVDIEIETEGEMPNVEIADRPITAVGFEALDRHEVFVLDPSGIRHITPSGIMVTPYASEREMLEDTLALMDSYPIILTYNGEKFDLPYIHRRATNLGMPGIGRVLIKGHNISLRNGIHIDLYMVFSNRSLQIYAFGNAYSRFSLDDVSRAMTGEGKMEHEGFGKISVEKLAEYCHRDVVLTYGLSEFGNGIVMRLLVIIARLANMPVDVVSRTSVSSWLRSMLHNEHRRRGILIPNVDELEARTTGVDDRAAVKGKKYRGAMVLEPRSGMHFGVSVMDFASLYPSIIKVKNLSYETVRCPHPECHNNAVPDTEHWVCMKRNGLVATLIGSLRDLRVNYYKNLAGSEKLTGEQREEYKIMAQALKVILNASYGVIGSDFFSMYFLPLADSTTAYGRHILSNVVKRCTERGLKVLYGDTDSLFLLKPPKEAVDEIMTETKAEYGVDLEMEKEYRYVILSDRKKNYLGVSHNGKVDIKGLTGKKSHTPKFIKDLFHEIVVMLSTVKDESGFIDVRAGIREKIKKCIADLDGGSISLQDLAFTVVLNKDPADYRSSLPQHIKAARLLETDKPLRKGDRIMYIKTRDRCGVKPMELANFESVDKRKYKEFIHSTLDQIITPLELNWDVMEYGKLQSEISAFMSIK